MDLSLFYIDQLIDLRETFRTEKDWSMCDKIRDYLDTKHVFIFDTPEGQVIYNQTKGTRKDAVEIINKEKRAVAMFDAWLVSTKESYKASEEKKRKNGI